VICITSETTSLGVMYQRHVIYVHVMLIFF